MCQEFEGKVWMTSSMIEVEKKFNQIVWDRMQKKLMYCTEEGFKLSRIRKVNNANNLKWAWIKIANTRKMVWVDTVTKKAYKADGYAQTNMEIRKFTFERWCTGFDL